MAKTDELIASLSGQASPVQPVAPHTQLARWIAGCVAYAIMALCLLGLRDDLSAKLESPLFLLELALLAAMVLATGISAIILSYPDMYQKKNMAWAFILPLSLFSVFLGVSVLDQPAMPEPALQGMECLACITLLSLLPAAGLMYAQRKLASTHYRAAGGIAMLAAASMGALILRLAEETDSFIHLAQWHYLPLAGFGMIGLWAGKRFLKW